MNTPGPTSPVHAPHIPLTDYYPTEQDRQAYLRRIFDDTAADYDSIEAIFAWGSGSRYRRQALIRGGLKTGMKVLDVGVGTGLVAAQACILVGNPALVTGVDPSPGMMAASKLPETMVLTQGRAESLPFPDNHFDFLSMGYARPCVNTIVSGNLLAAIMPGLGSTPVTKAGLPTRRQACAATSPVPTPTSSTFMPVFKPPRISAWRR